jgi:hypothetical protein
LDEIFYFLSKIRELSKAYLPAIAINVGADGGMAF